MIDKYRRNNEICNHYFAIITVKTDKEKSNWIVNRGWGRLYEVQNIFIILKISP